MNKTAVSFNGTRINKARLLKWVNRFKNVPILVVGDLMLDRVVRGSVDRISPEAPVPVLNVKEESFTAGGAGNVVVNLAALGAKPTLVAVRGNDVSGMDLVGLFESKTLRTDGLLVDPHLPTTTKTRFVAGQQQIVRIDFEKKDAISKPVQSQLLHTIDKMVKESKGVIISDYGKGVVSMSVIKHLLKAAHQQGVTVSVDPKIEHFMQYKGVDCVTPNTKEAVEGMRSLPPKTDLGFLQLGWKIVKRLSCQCLLMTRGEKGILMFLKNGTVKNIPAQAKEVFDVTGAGDTVIASFSLARAVGAPYEEAAQIANVAAGIVVGKLGTATASVQELMTAIKKA